MGENIIKRIILFLEGSWFERTKLGQGTMDVLKELENVSWPSKDEIKNSTVVVLITIAIFATYAAFWDYSIGVLGRLVY